MKLLRSTSSNIAGGGREGGGGGGIQPQPAQQTTIMLPPDLRVTTSFVIAEQGEWFEEELEFAATYLVQPGATVLDIGASYGLYSLALSAAVGPSGAVTSFEPHPGSAKALRASLAAMPIFR